MARRHSACSGSRRACPRGSSHRVTRSAAEWFKGPDALTHRYNTCTVHGQHLSFISYSSEDRDWLKRVVDSLSPLEHDGLVRIWTDRKLGGLDSEGWEKNLLRNLKEAGY